MTAIKIVKDQFAKHFKTWYDKICKLITNSLSKFNYNLIKKMMTDGLTKFLILRKHEYFIIIQTYKKK